MSEEFDTSVLLGGIKPPAEGEGRRLIKSVFHASLFENGITVRHKPRTGNTFEVDGVSNHVVTAYVEHAFLTWLLLNVHGIKPPAMPESANCQSEDVDAEMFFGEDLTEEDFLRSRFDSGDDITDEERAAAKRYITALESTDRRFAEAKKVCEGCPFSLECLTRSIMNNDEFGVWGGLDEKERHIMINRFENMRRSYQNGEMLPGMRRDFEDHAKQIAASISRAAKIERERAAA